MFWHIPRITTLFKGGAVAMLILVPMVVSAACSLSVGSLNFGSYDVFDSSHTDSSGWIEVSCDAATSYTLTLSAGAGSYSQRTLVNGTHTLNYNLYSDVARSQVWGDGTGSTVTVTGNTDSLASHTVYGRILANQNVNVGNYVDSIIVTLEF